MHTFFQVYYAVLKYKHEQIRNNHGASFLKNWMFVFIFTNTFDRLGWVDFPLLCEIYGPNNLKKFARKMLLKIFKKWLAESYFKNKI